MRLFFVLLFFFTTLTLSAQTIKAIKYEGLVHISEAVALRMLDFDVGDELDDAKVNQALQTYFKQGYFTDITVKEASGVLTFVFIEKSIISKVELEGWKENDDEVKDSVIQIKKGSLFDMKRLEAAKKRIIEAISQEGKIDTVVEIKTEHLENGSVKVVFAVNEGENIIIEKLEFQGLKGLEPASFNAAIANKEHQWMGWFWGRNDGKMKINEMGYDPLRIKDVYMQNGYLDAAVDEPFVRVDFGHYTAEMSYQIIEGEVYRVRDIVLMQEKEVIREEVIEEVLGLERNQPFNIKTFREDAERIKTKIADLGYAFVQVTPDLRKDRASKTVEVVYRIKPGSKVRIRNVIVSGNNRTLDRIIRRELFLAPGDMYSLTDLKDSKNSLGRTGFFESNTIEERRIDENTMDLVVKVKEAPTGNIQLGGGYGSFGGLLLSVAVNDRNVWGSGIDVGVRLEKSERTQNYSFNISNPRLNDSDFSGNFSIFKSSYQYNDYTVNTEGVSVGTGHRFTRHVSGYLGYTYSNNSYEDINKTAIENNNLSLFFEDYSKSSVTMSISYDDTDDYYLPREGFAMGQSFEKSGLGADSDFFKSRSTFNAYQGLAEYIGVDIIARYKARYNYALDTGFLPLAERFYMGGLGSVRGYESYSLAPIDSDGRRVGGDQTFSNSAELNFPLVPSAKMRLTAFVDWGIISGQNSQGVFQEIVRGGYGLGLEWFSPVGPIQLIFANPLLEEPEDRVTHFEFTIGQRF